MRTLLRRARARTFGAVLGACVLAPVAHADAPDIATLTLPAAVDYAVGAQPLLDAQRATVAAARERAVAARQLPDPMLLAGVSNVPANGPDRYSLSADFMTMTSVGVMQEFPLPGKRNLRGKAESLLADAGEARLAALERAVRRDAALAWLAVWFPERAAELTRSMAAEAEHERAAADIAYRAGRVPQADLLAADVEFELLRDRVLRFEQDAAEARAGLARWTGREVAGPVAADVPVLRAPPDLEALLAGLEQHPELAEAGLEVAAADTALGLARQGYWPDWRIEAMYGWRPDYAEMVTVQVGIDLPVFTGSRQDRESAAARQQVAAGEATRDDRRRLLHAAAVAAHQGWSQASARLSRYDDVIVPRATARAAAALAAYRAGKPDLASVLGARRAALDAELMRLELQQAVLTRLVALHYLDANGE